MWQCPKNDELILGKKMETYLVYVDTINNSNKFWAALVDGNNLTVQWGRVGYKPQTKVHPCGNRQQAIAKYHNLVAQKKIKGYRESQPQIDSACSIEDITSAIGLLKTIRSYMESSDFSSGYINALNRYLKIVPTPLGMQIDPYRIYQSVADVDHQLQLLNSLLPTTLTPTAISSDRSNTTAEAKTVSLKAISKNFWRHLG